MKIDIGTIFKELALPAGLVAVFAAVLGLVGTPLDVVLLIVEGLVGTFALIALVINVLKWAGVIHDGISGKLSAIANLIVVISVAVVFKLYPQFDFVSFDAQVAEFARVVGIVFAYLIQLVGTKAVHRAMSRGLHLQAFTFTPLRLATVRAG